MNTKEFVKFMFLFPAPTDILLQYTCLHKKMNECVQKEIWSVIANVVHLCLVGDGLPLVNESVATAPDRLPPPEALLLLGPGHLLLLRRLPLRLVPGVAQLHATADRLDQGDPGLGRFMEVAALHSASLGNIALALHCIDHFFRGPYVYL